MSTRTGPLDPVKLYKIFRSLLDQRLTGHLVLTRAQIVKRVRVHQGLPVRVVSNARRESAVVALQEQGFLTAADVDRVQQHREQARSTPEEALLKLGFLDRAQLNALEARLARRRLLEVFTWREGEYTFTPADFRLEQEDEAIDLVPLLVEAAGRVASDADCVAFCEQFRPQIIRLTPWADAYGAAVDTLFGTPNLRHSLARPSAFDELVAQLRDPERVARQVFTLVISGLAMYQRVEQGVTTSRPPPVRPASEATPVPLRGAAVAATPTPRPSPASAPARPVAPVRAPTPSASPVSATRGAIPETQAAPRPSRAPKAMDEKARQGLADVERIHAAMKRQTHYELLGVPKGADVPSVRAQFRGLARTFHVDRFTRYGLPPETIKVVQEVFMAINRAHDVLTDAEKRREYDAQLELAARGQRVGPSAGAPDMGAIFRSETLVRDAVMLLRNGNAAAARPKFEEALEASPGDVVARAGHAFSEFLLFHAGGALQEADKARGRLEEIVADQPARDEPYLYLGRVHRTRGDLNKAMALFKRALDVNPRCAEAASELRHLQRKAETPQDKSPGGLFGRKKA
ncbi:DnaJ domain-containing protein [Myxococcota bacterium]|nr:DnaJ domain-containing protein [Myxococcota bacterium]